MEHTYLITVDIGTSSTKTVLWDDAGQTVAESSHAYRLHRPDPLWAEIDGLVWWDAVQVTVRQVIAESGIDPAKVAAIGVDGVGWTLISVDADAKPLHPAMIWLDRRAEEETQWLHELDHDQRLVRLSANPLDSAYITPKLLWLKKHDPAVFERAHKFLTSTGFIVARLTGDFTCDITQAYGYHFFDMANACWDTGAADLIGIPLDKLPRLVVPTEVVGRLTAHAAEYLGLHPHTRVIAGCLDAASGALGAGVTRLGQTNEQGGQAGGFAISLDHVVVEPSLIFSHHVVPGQYLLQAGTVGGGSLGWFRDTLGQIETNAAPLIGQTPFELFSTQVATTSPGAHGLLFFPYMAGERTPFWKSSLRGVYAGMSYATTRGDMLRAVMEGCAFAVYDNLQIAESHGVQVSEYLGSGGATQSAVWCQIKADIYNRPFTVARRGDGREGGHSLGLFALTAFGIGLRDDIGACVEALLPRHQVFEPSADHHAMYVELFQVYRSISRKLFDDFDALASITRKFAL